jgi:hypothetical protein
MLQPWKRMGPAECMNVQKVCNSRIVDFARNCHAVKQNAFKLSEYELGNYSWSYNLTCHLSQPQHWLHYDTTGNGTIFLTYSYRLQPDPNSSVFSKFLELGWDWVHLVRRPQIGLLYQPRMIDDNRCGAVAGIRIGRGNRSTRRKPAPVRLCPPQIPRDLTWAGTRAATVGSRRLTAWAMARLIRTVTSSVLEVRCPC